MEGSNPDLYETIVHYFKGLCEDYENDEVYPDVVIAEYDRLSPCSMAIPRPATPISGRSSRRLFGTSGVASRENLETLFAKKLAGNPDDLDVLNQAVAPMSRAELYERLSSSRGDRASVQAGSVGQYRHLSGPGLPGQGRLRAKATDYLREALKVETDERSREQSACAAGYGRAGTEAMSPAARDVASQRTAREIQCRERLLLFHPGPVLRCGGLSGGFLGRIRHDERRPRSVSTTPI